MQNLFRKLAYAEKEAPDTSRPPASPAPTPSATASASLRSPRRSSPATGPPPASTILPATPASAPARSTATFPARDTLIEAVYRSEVEKLAAAEHRFATTMPALEALRAWMLLFIDHVSQKRLIIPAMDTVAGGSMRLIEGARSLIHTAFVASVKRAIASGDLRPDTDPNDFVRALVGIFHTTAMPGWEPSGRRLVDILIAGSRSTPKRASTPLRKRQK